MWQKMGREKIKIFDCTYYTVNVSVNVAVTKSSYVRYFTGGCGEFTAILEKGGEKSVKVVANMRSSHLVAF